MGEEVHVTLGTIKVFCPALPYRMTLGASNIDARSDVVIYDEGKETAGKCLKIVTVRRPDDTRGGQLIRASQIIRIARARHRPPKKCKIAPGFPCPR
jgi:hypothetical protein